MQQNKLEVPADGGYHVIVQRRASLLGGLHFRAIANHLDAFLVYALCQDAIAHVFTQRDHARRTSQGPPVHTLPHPREESWRDNRPSHRHIGVHIPDVVHVRFLLQQRHKCADNPLERRVSHGQDHVARQEEGARHRQKDVAQVIPHSFFHSRA